MEFGGEIESGIDVPANITLASIPRWLGFTLLQSRSSMQIQYGSRTIESFTNLSFLVLWIYQNDCHVTRGFARKWCTLPWVVNAVQRTPMMSEWSDRRACTESWRLAEVYESVLVARQNAVQKLAIGSISFLSERSRIR
jgi:hypothetical protein